MRGAGRAARKSAAQAEGGDPGNDTPEVAERVGFA
ncbi:hypothetical protein EV639_105210 [Rathayibacter tanaceti]|uniref:Uncharacterized protein n=2 Tax=Rathayibacter tanaceti TaxID=1671680 RepID=A0ACD2XKG1_9MICO|nr:hypothetical protein ACH61_01864 [Rathayibacter tanaceti]TCO37122.1 hypothetical protein EV639_105210 [Rathayibacter tanaceti]